MIINLIKNCDDIVDFLKKILSQTLNCKSMLSMQDDEGWTALHHAVYLGYTNSVALLLSYHASTNIQDNKGMTPLHIAIYYGYADLKIIELLLGAGADPNIKTKEGDNALFCAVKNIGNDLFRITELLINNGVDLNQQNYNMSTVLHILAFDSNGNEDTLQLLVDKGIDVNIQDVFGTTALHYAIWTNYIDIFTLHTKGPAVLLDTNNFKSYYAREDCKSGSVKAIKILISAGTNVNLQDESQCTPLHWLLSFHDDFDIYDLACELIKAGSDVNLKNCNGDTALHVVVKNVEYIACSKALNTWLSGYDEIEYGSNQYGWSQYDWDAGSWDAGASWGEIPNVDYDGTTVNGNVGSWGAGASWGNNPNVDDDGMVVNWGDIPGVDVDNNNSAVLPVDEVIDVPLQNTNAMPIVEFNTDEIHPDDIINGTAIMQEGVNYTFDIVQLNEEEEDDEEEDDEEEYPNLNEITNITKVDERINEPRSIREGLIELLINNGADINIKDNDGNDVQYYDAGFIKYYVSEIIKKMFEGDKSKLEFGECCICMNDTMLIGCRFKHNYCETCVGMSKSLRCDMCFGGFVYGSR